MTKLVNVVISGFCSQDSDKKELWASILDALPGQEVHAVTFESSTFFQLGVDLAIKGISMFSLRSLAGLFVNGIKDNEYTRAQSKGVTAGIALGHILP
jgi:hypothetical protein